MARKSLRTVRSALSQKLASQPPMDLPFLLLILTLVAFGLIMLGSASWAVGLYRRGDAYAYLRPQLLFAAVGLAALCLMMNSVAISFGVIQIPIELFALFAMIPICLYSGRKATASRGVQLGFYLFYPVHLAVLAVIMKLCFGG